MHASHGSKAPRPTAWSRRSPTSSSSSRASKAGLPDDAPAEARTLSETVAASSTLVDRENGTLVGITFCETEDDMRRADEALNQLSPTQGGGRRTSAEIYEVAIDEQLR